MINSTEYNRNFWNTMRGKNKNYESISAGRHSNTGSYQLPHEADSKYTEALSNESVFRNIATVLNAPKMDSTIRTFDAQEIATWLGDGSHAAYDECVDTFNTFTINNHRLGTIIRLSTDFTSDAGFDIEDYLVKSFAKSIGKTEENAFINGTGVDMPIGILNGTGGADIGVTASTLTYDDVIRLYFSLKPEYRKNAVWLMNDETALALRSLKDSGGNYLWRDSDDTILSKKVIISEQMPSVAGGAKIIAFGDFSYYWIIQRLPLTVRAMTEKYMLYQQIGYLGYEHLDAKLIRSEAIKVLKMAE
jgi:HK97 family phage major capsid protein